MKKLLMLFFAVSSTILLWGQSPFKRNDIYLEAGGNGLFGAINYERQLTKEPGLGVRAGIGFYTEKAFYLTIPIGINYLFPLKNKKSFIEAGAGITWARIDAKLFEKETNSHGDHFTNFIPSIGYRRHTKNDVLWRISITPVINKYAFTPSVGFSIGKRF